MCQLPVREYVFLESRLFEVSCAQNGWIAPSNAIFRNASGAPFLSLPEKLLFQHCLCNHTALFSLQAARRSEGMNYGEAMGHSRPDIVPQHPCLAACDSALCNLLQYSPKCKLQLLMGFWVAW